VYHAFLKKGFGIWYDSICSIGRPKIIRSVLWSFTQYVFDSKVLSYMGGFQMFFHAHKKQKNDSLSLLFSLLICFVQSLLKFSVRVVPSVKIQHSCIFIYIYYLLSSFYSIIFTYISLKNACYMGSYMKKKGLPNWDLTTDGSVIG